MEPSGSAVCLIPQMYSRQRSSRYIPRGSAVYRAKRIRNSELYSLSHSFSFLLSEHQVSQSSDVRIVAARASYRVPSSFQRSVLLSVDPEPFQFVSAASTSLELVSRREHFLEYVYRCGYGTKLNVTEHAPANRATTTKRQPDLYARGHHSCECPRLQLNRVGPAQNPAECSGRSLPAITC